MGTGWERCKQTLADCVLPYHLQDERPYTYCYLFVFCVLQGAPESILERCEYVRIGRETVPITEAMKEEIMSNVQIYGTGTVGQL